MTALVAHPLALLRGRAVDLALDREQRIDPVDRFDRDRRLGDLGQINSRRACAQHDASNLDRNRHGHLVGVDALGP